MAMGMTYEQFWEGEAELAEYYRRAYRLRREADNEQAWLQGLYIYDAVAVAVSNAFRGKGKTPASYLERPLDVFPLTEKEKKLREAEEYAKMQKVMESMVRRQKLEESKGDG